MKRMNILVVGAGAIGGMVGARLSLIGQSVTLLGRSTLKEVVNVHGLSLINANHRRHVTHPRVVENLSEIQDLQSFDVVFVTVKSYDTASALAPLENQLSADCTLLSLQNGVGNEQVIAERFPNNPIIAGSITLPVEVPAIGTIKISKEKGGIGLASFTKAPPTEAFGDILRQAGFVVKLYEDARSMKWSKLLMNIIGNATSAILDMSPTETMANQAIYNLEIEAIKETIKVIQAQGLKLVAFPDYPLPLLGWAIRWLPANLIGFVLRPILIGSRGDKLPSLLLDLKSGRTDSEISVLNGAVAQYSWEPRVPTPINTTLTQILQKIVSGQQEWAQFQRKPAALLDAVYNTK